MAYFPLCSQKSEDANLLSAICTYPVAWQARYFKKQYARIDPVIARGNEAVLPFDWDELPKDDPAVRAFFDDAVDHDVGRNGLSIPIFETARESELMLDQLVFDTFVGERTRRVETERLQIARQHLHGRDAAVLDCLDKLGAGREREILAAP